MDWRQKLIERYDNEFEDLYNFNPPNGWENLVESLMDYIHWHNKVHDTNVRVYSVDKKHGGLHFVVHHHPVGTSSSISEEIFGAIHLAETLSCKMCEVCGAPGTFQKIRVNKSLSLGSYCNEHFPKKSD